MLQFAFRYIEVDQFISLPIIGTGVGHCSLGVKAVGELYAITNVGKLVLSRLVDSLGKHGLHNAVRPFEIVF